MILITDIKLYMQQSQAGLLFVLVSSLFVLTNCSLGTYVEGTLHKISARPLSLNNPELKTCVFDPQYRIVHFPMQHYPPDGHYSDQQYEDTVQSQFQLLHTIRDYNRSPWQLYVFDENITADGYDQNYLQNVSRGNITGTYKFLDGRVFEIKEQIKRARREFHRIPPYYENLTKTQKNFLFNMGASFTLYFLGEVPKLYKVITPEGYKIIKAHLTPGNVFQPVGKNHVIFGQREWFLKNEVLDFYNRNYSSKMLIFIAYGANHNFYDEFSGLPFQSGHGFCLSWSNSFQRIPSFLP